MARQARYPVGRYKLALVEPLVGNLFYYDLDEPTVNVGIKNCQCVLPFDAMRLGQLLEVIPEDIQETPIAELMYDTYSGRWSVKRTHQQDYWDGEPDINDGEVFPVHLSADDWGFFQFKMVDLMQEGTAAQLPRQENETPGFKPTRLSQLPHIPLQKIAGHLGGKECLNSLIPADPFVIPKLLGGVPWKRYLFTKRPKTDILEAFRLLRLYSKDHVRELEIFLIFSEEAFGSATNILLQELSEFFTGASLEEVDVHYEHLSLIRRPNKATKKLRITASPSESTLDVGSMWSTLAALPLSESTKVALVWSEYALEFGTEQNPRPDFSYCQQLQEQSSALKNLTSLWYQTFDCMAVPPFALLPELRTLNIAIPGPFDYSAERKERFWSSLSKSRLVCLTHVQLSMSTKCIKGTVDALVEAAPKMKHVSLNTEEEDDQGERADITVPEMLTGLTALKKVDSLTTLRVALRGFLFDAEVEDALALFLDLKHLRGVELIGVRSPLPAKAFAGCFRELEKLGKIVEVEDIMNPSDSDPSDDQDHDLSSSNESVPSEFRVVVRDPNADVSDLKWKYY